MIVDSVFTGNLAQGAIAGGALVNYADGAAVTGSTFDSNIGAIGGGALVNLGDMTVDNCAFTTNNTPAGYGGGGAIWNSSGTLAVTNSIFSGNVAGYETASYPGYGGAIHTTGGVLTVTGSTFAGNVSWGYGGAISALGSLALTNNTLSENYALLYNGNTGAGGALYVLANGNAFTLALTHNTFAANTAPAASGGTLYLEQANGGILTATLYNNLLAKGATGRNCVYSGPTPTASHNLADDATCGAGFTHSSSIGLGALGDYGGSTPTIPLLFNSPAIDAGNATYCPATDQRGVARDDWACDIGAFEVQLSDTNTVSKTISAAGPYTFGPTGVKIEVTDTGGCLTGLTVERVAGHHAYATTPLQTGAYWVITPTSCTSGFTVTLTLPASFVPAAQDKVCRYTGVAQVWDCAATTFDAARQTLTRAGVTAFSDWTVGHNAGPTTIRVRAFAAHSWAWGALLPGVLLVALVRRRRRRQ